MNTAGFDLTQYPALAAIVTAPQGGQFWQLFLVNYGHLLSRNTDIGTAIRQAHQNTVQVLGILNDLVNTGTKAA